MASYMTPYELCFMVYLYSALDPSRRIGSNAKLRAVKNAIELPLTHKNIIISWQGPDYLYYFDCTHIMLQPLNMVHSHLTLRLRAL